MKPVDATLAVIQPICGLQTIPIPLECALDIFSYLSLKEICNVQLTCKEWKRVSDEDVLWKEFCRRDQVCLGPSDLSVKLQYYIGRMFKKGAM